MYDNTYIFCSVLKKKIPLSSSNLLPWIWSNTFNTEINDNIVKLINYPRSKIDSLDKEVRQINYLQSNFKNDKFSL